MRIPMKYCHEIAGSDPWKYYVILPAEHLPVPKGYEMHYLVGSAKVDGDYIVTDHGNENYTPYSTYMFEYGDTSRRTPHKRYRFSEDEMYIAYARDEDPDFDKKLERRKEEITVGQGFLVRAEYPVHVNGRTKKTEKAWFISPDSSKWLYALDYDILRDKGDKHRKSNESIRILEKSYLWDLSLVRHDEQELYELLSELGKVRDMCVEPKCDNFIEYLTDEACSCIPDEVITDTLYFELDQMSKQMIQFCDKAVSDYKKKREFAISHRLWNTFNIPID